MIPLVILAAGLSSRMGRTKALLPLPAGPGPGETFLSRIVRSARQAGVPEIIVVLGHDAESIRSEIIAVDEQVRCVVNPDYMRGQLSSLLVGLNAADRLAVRAIMMTLVDVPLVAASTIRAVMNRYEQTHAPIVRPVNGQLHGHPVLIDRLLFDDLRRADPLVGAKTVVRRNVSAAGDVAVDDAGAFVDVDTMEEYLKISSVKRR
jgi:molybdenum cofactor cytidylyltransferase